jgi:hypothetical protein
MKKFIILVVLTAILISACSSQASTPVIPTPRQNSPTAAATQTAVPPTATTTQVPPSATSEPILTATSTVTLFPTVTFSEDVTCRMGPDLNYFKVVSFTAGQTSQVQGRSDDSQWLNVLTQASNQSYTCWVPLTSVKSIEGAADLRVIAAAQLPTGATVASVLDKNYCGVIKQGKTTSTRGPVVLDWSPAADGTGFFVYRNGKNLAAVYGGEYIDYDTPGSKTPYVYTYTIQAFNSVGLSKVSASVNVTLCD